MSNNSHKTKLRGTESRSYSQFQASSNEELEVEPKVSGVQSPLNSQDKKKSAPKCGGRGMAIKQLEESLMAKSNRSLTNYSNSSIENHFKNLQKENLKKMKDENEKIWGEMVSSSKTS